MSSEYTIQTILGEAQKKLGHLPRHPQAKLEPYEVAAIGMLRALRGGSFRSFYQWLSQDRKFLFNELPDRTRLTRLLTTHQELVEVFLARGKGDLIIDTYCLEMLHPIREYRKKMRSLIAKKGKSNFRWMVGAKMAVLVRQDGRVVDWDWDSANVHDSNFLHLIEDHPKQTVLADLGFRSVSSTPANLVLCHQKERNERMVVERLFSVLTLVSKTKRLWERTESHISAYFSYLFAVVNCLFGRRKGGISLAEYGL